MIGPMMHVDPLHVTALTVRQAYALGMASATSPRPLVDLDGYVADDRVTADLYALEAVQA